MHRAGSPFVVDARAFADSGTTLPSKGADGDDQIVGHSAGPQRVLYSAIASDLKRYSALRAMTNGKVEDDQHAKKILNRLSGINPKFMPMPQGIMVVQPDGVKHFEGLDEAQQATLARFSDLFDEASDHLHAANPFVPGAQVREQALRQGSRARLIKARDYLKVALWDHYKMGLEFKSGDDPKALDDFKTVCLVSLNKPDQEDITMHLATRKDNCLIRGLKAISSQEIPNPTRVRTHPI